MVFSPFLLLKQYYFLLSLQQVLCLKKQADQKYLEFIIQLEKLGVEIIENNVTIESSPKDYRMNVQFLLEANASEKCTLESQVQELQKQE